MLFKSALVTQASGSIGGMTASRNRGGMYFRSRAIPTDPNTTQQAAIRAAMGSLVQRWINTLSLGQRNNWNVYAANVPLPGPLGDPITVSGLNHYVRSNTPRVQTGNAIVDAAPFIFDTGTLSPVSIANLTEAGASADVTFTDADGWNVAGGSLLIYVSRPLNPTINFFRGPYRVSDQIQGIAVSPVTISITFPFVATQRMYFRARATYADGRLTQEQFIGPITAAA